MRVIKKVTQYDADRFFPEVYPWPAGVKAVKGKRVKYRLRTDKGLFDIKPGMWIVTHSILGTQIVITDAEFQEKYEAI